MLDQRLLKEARKARYYLILTIGLGIIMGFIVVFQAKTLASVVSLVFIERYQLAQVRPLLILLLGLIFVRAFVAWYSEISAQRVAARIKADLRRRVLQQLFELGPIYVKGERTGELINLMVEGIESLEEYFAKYIPQLVLAVAVPLTVLLFVLPIDVTSGLILLITAPLIPFFMILIGKWADHLTKRQWHILSRMSAHFLDVLQGLTTLKLFNRSKDQIKVIGRISDDFRKTTMGVLRVAFLSALVLELLATISTALVAVGLGVNLVYNHITFEKAFFLLLLAPEFYSPLRLLGLKFHAGMNGMQAAERIFEVLDQPVCAETTKLPKELINAQRVQLSFENVHFSYGTAEVLRGVTFDLCPGEKIALIGPSGAGKSTITNLLMGYIKPTKGLIKVNGITMKSLASNEWRQLVSMVPQTTYLFYGTVAENILLARPGATESELREAAHRAGAHEFIEKLPQGYNTPVGEQGIKLSGGQAQRLAIARAFLKNAPILILDEVTTGLDLISDLAVQEAIEQLMKGRTVLVIAHRLSTIYGANNILVLNEGQIEEKGRHQELMEQKKLYYDLVRAYRGGES
ncbi:thiol reductant ABC exporter subunit CydD [Desulfotomaculum defluvii]